MKFVTLIDNIKTKMEKEDTISYNIKPNFDKFFFQNTLFLQSKR